MTGAAGGDRAPETAGRGALLDRWQRSFYLLHFQLAFRTKVAKEFEDWFCRLAGFALGADFERIRPYGAEGDHKADGRTQSDGTIYQCYAPGTVRANRVRAKIRDDFDGARRHWPGFLKRWIFVHNDREGLAAQVAKELDTLRESGVAITVEAWSEDALTRLFERLDIAGLESLFGVAPSRDDRETLAPEDVEEVVRHLEGAEASGELRPIREPSFDKIDKNALSEYVIVLLRAGKSKDDVIREFFERHPAPDTGERVANGFRRQYVALREMGRSSDDIFVRLQQYMGAGESTKLQVAALAVMSYLFDRCDIFEDPDRNPQSGPR